MKKNLMTTERKQEGNKTKKKPGYEKQNQRTREEKRNIKEKIKMMRKRLTNNEIDEEEMYELSDQDSVVLFPAVSFVLSFRDLLCFVSNSLV